jgi:hypothetical protein
VAHNRSGVLDENDLPRVHVPGHECAFVGQQARRCNPSCRDVCAKRGSVLSIVDAHPWTSHLEDLRGSGACGSSTSCHIVSLEYHRPVVVQQRGLRSVCVYACIVEKLKCRLTKISTHVSSRPATLTCPVTSSSSPSASALSCPLTSTRPSLSSSGSMRRDSRMAPVDFSLVLVLVL